MNIHELEKQVMDKLLQGEQTILKKLNEQYYVSRVVCVEYTGVGFYIDYCVPEQNWNLPKDLDFCFGDVHAYLNNADQPVGFLLWVTDGILDFLEAYTYDMPWPKEITEYRLEYISEQRLLQNIPHIDVK